MKPTGGWSSVSPPAGPKGVNVHLCVHVIIVKAHICKMGNINKINTIQMTILGLIGYLGTSKIQGVS